MAVTTEARVNALEDELKALKAIYSIAGGLARMYVQTSDSMTVGGSSSFHAMTAKFTPTYGVGKNNLITITPIVTSTYAGYTWDTIPNFRIEPQDGSGDVVVKVYNLVNDDKVRFIASGSSPGTFTRLS